MHSSNAFGFHAKQPCLAHINGGRLRLWPLNDTQNFRRRVLYDPNMTLLVLSVQWDQDRKPLMYDVCYDHSYFTSDS